MDTLVKTLGIDGLSKSQVSRMATERDRADTSPDRGPPGPGPDPETLDLDAEHLPKCYFL